MHAPQLYAVIVSRTCAKTICTTFGPLVHCRGFDGPTATIPALLAGGRSSFARLLFLRQSPFAPRWALARGELLFLRRSPFAWSFFPGRFLAILADLPRPFWSTVVSPIGHFPTCILSSTCHPCPALARTLSSPPYDTHLQKRKEPCGSKDTTFLCMLSHTYPCPKQRLTFHHCLCWTQYFFLAPCCSRIFLLSVHKTLDSPPRYANQKDLSQTSSPVFPQSC